MKFMTMVRSKLQNHTTKLTALTLLGHLLLPHSYFIVSFWRASIRLYTSFVFYMRHSVTSRTLNMKLV